MGSCRASAGSRSDRASEPEEKKDLQKPLRFGEDLDSLRVEDARLLAWHSYQGVENQQDEALVWMRFRTEDSPPRWALINVERGWFGSPVWFHPRNHHAPHYASRIYDRPPTNEDIAAFVRGPVGWGVANASFVGGAVRERTWRAVIGEEPILSYSPSGVIAIDFPEPPPVAEHELPCPNMPRRYGCADVEGRVLDRTGRPVSGASVGPHYLPSEEMVAYTGIYKQTDPEGRFRFRIHRAMRPMHPLPQPDTFSFYVVAVLAGHPDACPWPIDSTLVQVEVARPGEMPTPASVEIRLPVP